MFMVIYVLLMLVHDCCCSLVGRFPVSFWPSLVLSGNTACASTSIKPKVIPYESTIPSYMRYLPPFQVNLYVPNSKPSNEIMFCMLE